VLVLAGPTASGKTALSLALALSLGGEVISADSVQVYSGLDCGSAKLPPSQRCGVPHHLLDVAPPTTEFSAGDWVDAALAAAADVAARGAVPIVVGGSGFYLRWLTEGKPPTPRSTPAASAAAAAELRRAADAAEAAAGPAASGAQREAARWQAALDCLSAAGDPASAARLVRNDWYRAERSLEIVRVSGRPVGAHAPARAAAFDFRCFHLAVPRLALYRRIDARCEAMLADALLEEAAALWAAGLRPGDDGREAPPAGRSIGYAQALALLGCAAAGGGREALRARLREQLREMQRASRNYAKRQGTWFRGEPAYRWVDARAGVTAQRDEVLAAFAAPQHAPCAAAADAAEAEDARAAGGAALLEAAAAGDERAAAKAAKLRARALMCYATEPSGALTAAREEELLDWLERWARQQAVSPERPAQGKRAKTEPASQE